ncbi:citrate lyase beta subunit [Nocardioides luteus]|uniref:Aldolase n=1 Tax=Nocardioides luteus TaxID=1844 RepID=A0ABQ5SRJ7_9ACTN|nr:aldolase/citrate lyase family protein [Nocardioides luteus]MDR7313469.1 citrate lyase beta subunit [Nocardioides luteus]GGR61072.1 aldolase [Nocardioides luteus]GLJ66534.1 aldolase [Nocardioides luteus]
MSGFEELAARLDRALAGADAALAASYPGDRGVRQPVHTVYVPGDRYSDKTVVQWSTDSGQALAEHAAAPAEVAAIFGLGDDLADAVYDRVRAKLAAEPIEDLRIDFEDGYGNRPDEDEDAAVIAAARALAATVRDGSAPPFHGIRIKSFEAPTRRRGLRTLDLFLGELARAGGLGDGLVLTLPKVTSVEQVTAMVTALDALEPVHGIEAGSLRFEIQVETPQAILGSDGTALVARMIAAGAGRVTGLHYGTYDYSASLGVAAAFQSMEHPVADHAKDVMQVAAAGTGVFVSDGSTNVLPVGGPEAVRDAWRLHSRLVSRSLARGIYQGWDLHPAQLPSRYVATYAFFRDGLDVAAARLKAYVHGGDSSYLDEPATAAALAAFVVRGVECGAVAADEVERLAGIDRAKLDELARRPAG